MASKVAIEAKGLVDRVLDTADPFDRVGFLSDFVEYPLQNVEYDDVLILSGLPESASEAQYEKARTKLGNAIRAYAKKLLKASGNMAGGRRQNRARAKTTRASYPRELGWNDLTILVAKATGITNPTVARRILDEMTDYPGPRVSDLSPRAFAHRARAIAGMGHPAKPVNRSGSRRRP